MAGAHQTRPQVPIKAAAHLLGPPNAKALLERLKVIRACRTQESPEAQPDVIQRALDVLQTLWRDFAKGDLSLDRS
jgi:hypothetical protein